ncbi:MAG TPA: hypothetical protein DDZ88_05070 [Verrucomicrobiales bacterium]|nr:hypothetical protein [Verrucomicrobiales bacterium]
MPNYIDLHGADGWLGEFDLPTALYNGTTRFQIGKALKGGGNGIVFSAHQYLSGKLERACAVKFLRRLDDQRRDRFNNEIRIAKLLHHPNIATCFGEGTTQIGGHSVPWMSQQAGGRNLRETVFGQGKIAPDLLKIIAGQMCLAVAHLHEHGFIHRDIKPDNFVWGEIGQFKEVMMIDLGIAKRMGEDVSGRPLDQFTRSMEFVGPVFYSSPELIEYARDKSVIVDERSDIFQLGKTLWFLATSKISAGIPSRTNCPFGGKFADLIMETIQDDPAARPPSAHELAKRLAEL